MSTGYDGASCCFLSSSLLLFGVVLFVGCGDRLVGGSDLLGDGGSLFNFFTNFLFLQDCFRAQAVIFQVNIPIGLSVD